MTIVGISMGPSELHQAPMHMMSLTFGSCDKPPRQLVSRLLESGRSPAPIGVDEIFNPNLCTVRNRESQPIYQHEKSSNHHSRLPGFNRAQQPRPKPFN